MEGELAHIPLLHRRQQHFSSVSLLQKRWASLPSSSLCCWCSLY